MTRVRWTGTGPRPRQVVLASTLALPLCLAGWSPHAAAGLGLEEESSARVLFRIEGGRLAESSGLAVNASDELFYAVQDAGKSSDVFVLDLTGRTRQAVSVPFPNEDWEDLATVRDERGGRALYIADTGDAFFLRRDAGQPPRKEYAIIRLGEPALDQTRPAEAVPAQEPRRFRFVFDDDRTHNAETLLVQPGSERVFVVDKVEPGRPEVAYLWAAAGPPSEQAVNTFSRVAQVAVPAASGGAFSPTGDRMVMRNSTTAFLWRVQDGDVPGALQKRPVEIPLPAQPQGEGVAFSADGNALLLSSEGVGSLVWELPLPSQARAEVAAAAPAGPAAPEVTERRVGPILVAATAALGVGALLLHHNRSHSRRRPRTPSRS